MAIDYQFTFNLSKAEDKHLRGINFKNTPTKHEVDVDFSITCSVPAKMNMTVKYTSGGKVFVYLGDFWLFLTDLGHFYQFLASIATLWLYFKGH